MVTDTWDGFVEAHAFMKSSASSGREWSGTSSVVVGSGLGVGSETAVLIRCPTPPQDARRARSLPARVAVSVAVLVRNEDAQQLPVDRIVGRS